MKKNKIPSDTADGAATAKAETAKKRLGEKAGGWMREMRNGEVVPVDFFTNNAWILIIFLVAILSLIGLRYKTKSKMAEIKQLRHNLEIVQSEKLREKAEYMSLIRETEMRRLVNEKHLGLVFQEQPPYEIQLSE